MKKVKFDIAAMIRPPTAGQAQYFTNLATEACNDRELLPPRLAALLDDRKALAEQIAQATPDEDDAAPRRRREL
jgi:hypothetical protein